MALTQFPKILKYAVGDRPYTLNNTSYEYFDRVVFKNGRTSGMCRRVKITGWRTEVESADGTTGTQTNYYTVKNIVGYEPDDATVPWEELYDSIEYELAESKLFSSHNHLLSSVKGKYINSPFGDLVGDGSKYFESMGNLRAAPGVSNGDWIDWAGMDFSSANFIIDGEDVSINYLWNGDTGEQSEFTGGELGQAKTFIVDNCTFEGATMPVGLNTKTKIRSSTFSYDKDTTIWVDGFKMGIALSGTGAGSLAGNTLTGTSTAFTTEVRVGDTIWVNGEGEKTVTAIASDTSLTISGTWSANFSGKLLSNNS